MGMRLKGYLIAGIATAVPLFVTTYILLIIVRLFDDISQPLVVIVLGRSIPGLGVLVTLGTLILLGMFVSVTLGRKTAEYFEGAMLNIPLSRSIYSVAKNVVDTFLFGKKELGKVVMVKLTPDIFAIGFLTGNAPRAAEDAAATTLCSVFVPTAPNPTTGLLLLLPEDHFIPLDMSFDRAMEVIISAGLSRSQDKQPPKEG
ncbi:MAG: DUF502 domain-containing protein [Methanotrichaceae archaeon]|nr:DUF502 domain-containing protein [Methanotrichaceae archaeon]